MKSLNIDYSYTEAALAAINSDRKDDPAGAEGFMTYRCSLHMLFHPHQTFLVTEVGMFWTTEIVSVCANNHVWFCTIDEWKRKLKENPSFHAAEIFDPLADASLDVDDGKAVMGFIQNKDSLSVKPKTTSPGLSAMLDAAVAEVNKDFRPEGSA